MHFADGAKGNKEDAVHNPLRYMLYRYNIEHYVMMR